MITSSLTLDKAFTWASVGIFPVHSSQKRPSGNGSLPPAAFGNIFWHSGIVKPRKRIPSFLSSTDVSQMIAMMSRMPPYIYKIQVSLFNSPSPACKKKICLHCCTSDTFSVFCAHHSCNVIPQLLYLISSATHWVLFEKWNFYAIVSHINDDTRQLLVIWNNKWQLESVLTPIHVLISLT